MSKKPQRLIREGLCEALFGLGSGRHINIKCPHCEEESVYVVGKGIKKEAVEE